MNTSKAFSVVRSFLATALLPTMLTAAHAADQFVQVAHPGWTNTGQYSFTGAWGDYDNDGFIDLFVPNSTTGWGAWTNFLYPNNGDSTFTRQSANQVGSIASDRKTSWGGYWGDVNNDGFLDLLAVGDAVQLYLNNGDGSFRSADAGGLSKVFGSNDGWLACADYDHDGNLDVFACTAPHNRLFHGRGDGTFQWVTNSVVSLDTVSYSNDAAWGDFDNDGLPDLIVANWSVHDFFYHNDGHGQFRRMTNSILEECVGSHHAWGDLDNDGSLDLAAGNTSGNMCLFRNDGMGDFVTATNLSAAAAATPVWVDYDNDGYLDLLVIHVQSSPAQLQLYHSNGDGTFREVEDSFTRTSANWFGGGWGDYDNDGFMDLFMTQTSGQNSLFHNLGNTNHWIKFQLQGVAANRSAIGAKVRVKATIGGKTFWQMREVSGGNYCQNDLRLNFGLGDATNVNIVRMEWPSGNRQEMTDVSPNQILAVKEVVHVQPTNPSSSLNGSVTLTRTALLGATYQWQFEGTDLAGETNKALTLAGIQSTQAGRYSVIVTTSDQIVTNYVYLQVDPTFTKITTGPMATELGDSWGGSWGDDDGDGYADLFVARHGTGRNALYHNNGNGTFTARTNTPTMATSDVWSSGAWADLDNDGRLDLFAARNGKTAFLYFNEGDGIFTSAEFKSLSPFSISITDYNQDGLLDLFIPSYPEGVCQLFRNNGDRTFARVTAGEAGALANTSTFGGAAWADYDDDGLIEVYASDYGGSRNYLLHDDGTGRYFTTTNLVTQTGQPAIGGAWGDYDNDGLLDLCVACLGGPSSALYHNLGNGRFESPALGVKLSTANSASWADYDNDGFLDLFTTFPNRLYHNNGDGTLTRVETGTVGNENAQASYAGLWFDDDNDGFLDLYVFNGNDAGTANIANSYYHNNGNSNAWLKVKLIGTASNHDGIGAKVRAQAKYAGQVRSQRRDISAGDANNGNNLIAHFGLGDATYVMTLLVEWPSGAVREFTNIAPRQLLTVWEPPSLRAAVQPDGSCDLTVTAEPNQPWQIESSVNLRRWQPLATVQSPSQTCLYTDRTDSGSTGRFYRVAKP